MNHLRTVQTRNVVVSNVMMSNAPKMTCPGDPRAQTHTQIVRAYLSAPSARTRTRIDSRKIATVTYLSKWFEDRSRNLFHLVVKVADIFEP